MCCGSQMWDIAASRSRELFFWHNILGSLDPDVNVPWPPSSTDVEKMPLGCSESLCGPFGNASSVTASQCNSGSYRLGRGI
jgi:hypothetical protein